MAQGVFIRIQRAGSSGTEGGTGEGIRSVLPSSRILPLVCLATFVSILVLPIAVGGAWGSSPPTADDVPPAVGCTGDMHIETGEWAVFNGANSTDDIGIVNWTWFFIYDDRERTLFGEETTFHFDEPGSYSVRLTVWDAAGNQNSTVFLVTVGDIVVPDTHTPSRLEGWIWAVAGLAFVFALVVILGFIKRVTPRRPPGEDPYHHTYR